MKFNRSIRYDCPSEIQIGYGTTVEVVKTLKILGIQVEDSLKWNAQIKQMTERATNNLGYKKDEVSGSQPGHPGKLLGG